MEIGLRLVGPIRIVLAGEIKTFFGAEGLINLSFLLKV